MFVIKYSMRVTLFAVLVVHFNSSYSYPGQEKCYIQLPRAMGINKFNSRVATGTEWVALFPYICPFNPRYSPTRQFRTSFNVTNGVLTRVTNFRPSLGQPCVGASTDSFDQVGSERAVFRQTGTDGLIREDRYLDTGALDDYYINVSCLDMSGARRGKCFNYFVVIMIRHDPPTNFPWDRAVLDMKRFGIKPRDFIFQHVGDECPLI